MSREEGVIVGAGRCDVTGTQAQHVKVPSELVTWQKGLT
jgi:hypothetical protein